MKDILLHAAAGAGLALLAAQGPAGIVMAVTLMWLLRELAQRDKGNLMAAARTMPAWSAGKHAEWLAPGLAGAAALWLLRALT